jgi:hypothetical protein
VCERVGNVRLESMKQTNSEDVVKKKVTITLGQSSNAVCVANKIEIKFQPLDVSNTVRELECSGVESHTL